MKGLEGIVDCLTEMLNINKEEEVTDREICEKIVKQGNCNDIHCDSDKCPLCGSLSGLYCGGVYDCVEKAKKWLEDHKEEEMTDIERLEKVIDEAEKATREAKAQIEEIKRKKEEEKRIVFSSDKLYGFIPFHSNLKHIMTYGSAGSIEGYRFNSIAHVHNRFEFDKKTGQECIDWHLERGKIYIFDNRREALEWMLEE